MGNNHKSTVPISEQESELKLEPEHESELEHDHDHDHKHEPKPEQEKSDRDYVHDMAIIYHSKKYCDLCGYENTDKCSIQFECGCYMHEECSLYCLCDRCPICRKTSQYEHIIGQIIQLFLDRDPDTALSKLPLPNNNTQTQCKKKELVRKLHCPLCMVSLNQKEYLPYYFLSCNHVYHASCLLYHVLEHSGDAQCLICKQPITLALVDFPAFKSLVEQCQFQNRVQRSKETE